MNGSGKTSAVLDAMRLGFAEDRVERFSTDLVLHPETMTIRADSEDTTEEYPLIICLHPHRLTEFQFAQKIRGLTRARAHFAFPQGLYPNEVDLGGARTVCYAWCHYTGDNPTFRRDLARAIEYLDQVVEKILSNLPVDRQSIYILGIDSAAFMAAIYGVARSDLFAGAINVGGAIHSEILFDFLPEEKRIPFLSIYNHNEKIVRSGDVTRQVNDLQNYGIPVDLHISNAGFEGWESDENYILSWLEQSAQIEIAAEEISPKS